MGNAEDLAVDLGMYLIIHWALPGKKNQKPIVFLGVNKV